MRNLVEKPACQCPVKFPVEKQPKGRYRVGEKILYVRVSGAHGVWSLMGSRVRVRICRPGRGLSV